MILSRFSIRGKLNILLLLALAAVLLVAVPFVAGQIGNARSAARTADAARDTQELSGLIWELQRERLVTAAYLATPTPTAELGRQQARVDSAAEGVRSAVGADASDELASALVRLGSLQEPRQSALRAGSRRTALHEPTTRSSRRSSTRLGWCPRTRATRKAPDNSPRSTRCCGRTSSMRCARCH